jgi:hypothetical protein
MATSGQPTGHRARALKKPRLKPKPMRPRKARRTKKLLVQGVARPEGAAASEAKQRKAQGARQRGRKCACGRAGGASGKVQRNVRHRRPACARQGAAQSVVSKPRPAPKCPSWRLRQAGSAKS